MKIKIKLHNIDSSLPKKKTQKYKKKKHESGRTPTLASVSRVRPPDKSVVTSG
jgi:hypothetical protein